MVAPPCELFMTTMSTPRGFFGEYVMRKGYPAGSTGRNRTAGRRPLGSPGVRLVAKQEACDTGAGATYY